MLLILQVSQVILGRLTHLCVLPVWWLVKEEIFLGQYVHLPNLVQIFGLSISSIIGLGGYDSLLFVSMSRRLGNLLNPINGFCVKIFFNSSQCSIIFQFEWMNFLMFGFLGLYFVTITGGVLFFILVVLASKSSFCVNFFTLSWWFLRCFLG